MMLFFIFICCYMIYQWSVSCFCIRYLNNIKINRIFFGAILFIGGIAINLFYRWTDTQYILVQLLSHVLFTALLLIVFQDDTGKKVLTAAVLLATKILVWNFAGSFLSCLFLVTIHLGTKGQVMFLGLVLDDLIGDLSCIITAFAILILRKKMTEVYENKFRNWYFTIAIPLFFLVLIVDVVNWGAAHGILVVSNADETWYGNVYYDQIFSHTGICLLLLLAMCIATGLIFGMNKLLKEQQKAEQYHSQIGFYKMLNEQYSRMEGLRHDMKNHILSLYGLWKGKEQDKLGDYLEKMLESGNLEASHEITGNQAIDALLYHKKMQAEAKGITWECSIQLPKKCSIEEFNLCVLLGNMLDNALQACEEVQEGSRRFINAETQSIKNCLLLTVKNGTNKNNVSEIKEGTGLSNIKEAVKKYDGTFNIQIKDQVFEISVLLPMDAAAYNTK